ncbi:hypothetical protein EEL32_11590 [Brevibacillus laterosporus]|nr:hypothetical protein EEL32_11590 [Brevibacillus laterosporus]
MPLLVNRHPLIFAVTCGMALRWLRKGTPFHSDFMKTIQAFYHAKVTELDFNNPKAPVKINDWVNKNTNGKIPKMIESTDPMEVLILI